MKRNLEFQKIPDLDQMLLLIQQASALESASGADAAKLAAAIGEGWSRIPAPERPKHTTLEGDAKDVLAEYAPNIKEIILHRQVISPLDLEQEYGLTGGNIFHGEMEIDQLFSMRPVAGWAQYRTPIRNLYLCGSGAHPGGGVMGAPGYNASREILRDLK